VGVAVTEARPHRQNPHPNPPHSRFATLTGEEGASQPSQGWLFAELRLDHAADSVRCPLDRLCPGALCASTAPPGWSPPPSWPCKWA
jgi:hypothetical protein